MFRFCSVAFLAVGVAYLMPAGAARAGGKPHPHLHHALYELREARTELKEAAHNFGGHRKEALKAVNAAIGQLEKALKFSGDKRPFKGDPTADYYKKYKNHPHIRHAIRELKETVVELKAASHDYGGHREAALMDTRAAIRQLELCLEFVNKK